MAAISSESSKPTSTSSSAPPNPFLIKLICGAIAGITGTLIIYPLDAIKTRLQTISMNPGAAAVQSSTSTVSAIKSVVQKEGIRNLYKGMGANLIGITPEKAIKLAVNDFSREYLAKKYGYDADVNLPVTLGMLAGGFAGFCQVIVTNPMEIVKIRLQLSSLDTQKQSTSLSSVIKELGLKGMYRGTSITLMRDVPFSFIFFPSSAVIRQHLAHYFPQKPFLQDENPVPSITAVFLGGVGAGCLAAGLVTPADVVKTRFQSSSDPKVSILGIARNVYNTHGISGFFRGWKQRCMIVSPLFGITLLVYEAQQRWFAGK